MILTRKSMAANRFLELDTSIAARRARVTAVGKTHRPFVLIYDLPRSQCVTKKEETWSEKPPEHASRRLSGLRIMSAHVVEYHIRNPDGFSAYWGNGFEGQLVRGGDVTTLVIRLPGILDV